MTSPVPLRDQISEVKRELALREAVYPGLIARGKLTETEAAVHKARLAAVLRTLDWLQDNRDRVKELFPKATAAALIMAAAVFGASPGHAQKAYWSELQQSQYLDCMRRKHIPRITINGETLCNILVDRKAWEWSDGELAAFLDRVRREMGIKPKQRGERQ